MCSLRALNKFLQTKLFWDFKNLISKSRLLLVVHEKLQKQFQNIGKSKLKVWSTLNQQQKQNIVSNEIMYFQNNDMNTLPVVL